MTQINPSQINPASWTNNQILKLVAWEVVFANETGWAGGIETYEILSGTMSGLTPVKVIDSRISVDTPYNIYFETQPAGHISRTTIWGKITLVSDDAGDTMNFKIVAFWFGSNSGYATGTGVFNGAWPVTVVDSRIHAGTPVNVYPATGVVGYRTVVASEGSFEISSTASETNIGFSWIAFTDEPQVVTSGLMAYDTSGTGTSYTVSIPGITAYNDNLLVTIRFSETNGNSSTLNINWLWAKLMYDVNNNIIWASKINTNDTYIIRYESSNDSFYISRFSNIGEWQNITNNFADLFWYDVAATTYALPGMNDSNSIVYDWIRYLYITCLNTNKVHKFDTRTNTQIGTLTVNNWPYHLCSIANGFLYVPCYLWTEVAKVDLSSFTVSWYCTVWDNPSWTLVYWWYLYVSSAGGNRVHKIDIATFTNVANVAVGNAPRAITTDGTYLYVACSDSNRVHKIDIATFTNVANVAVGTYSTAAVYESWYVYVWSDSRIDKIDIATFTNIWNLSVPGWVSWRMSLHNWKLYAPSSDTDTINVVNLVSFTKEGVPLAVGDWPQEIAFVWDKVYVANQGSNNLTLLSSFQLTAPATWYYRLYFKTDWKLYRMNSTGAEQLIGTQS